MEKKMTNDPYNKNRNIYLLGVRKGVYYWLKEPTWNTNGHWGFGYVITYTNNETPNSTSEVLTYQHFDRIFLSDKTWGITTWAMSKGKMEEYIRSGIWDSCTVGSGSDNFGNVGKHKGDGSYPTIEKAAYSVSQYFKMGEKEIQIRTSGYAKFADTEIDPDVLAGRKTINATGVLTLYQGSVQFILLDIDGVNVNE
jgi:hypothetical protein